MKYTKQSPPTVCMLSTSTCYKSTRIMTPKGILWHSTGANNPTLKRYVQPADNDPNRLTLLELIGKNRYGNDQNHRKGTTGMNAWIGKLADGSVTTLQTMPFTYRPWGCGGGSKGSCNDHWIQFEICEDSLKNSEYAETVYREACELTAYLCSIYDIDPHGTVLFKGLAVPTILCHRDAHSLGLGSNHTDVLHWFPRYGFNMNTARKDVISLLKGNTTSEEYVDDNAQTTVAKFFTLTRNLKKGLSGADVSELQNLLNIVLSTQPLVIDGIFGSKTRTAVKQFQTIAGITVDGIYGPISHEKLIEAVARTTIE